ncbi:CPA1 family monovalent cation:H+ antiporter [Actinoplanes lutulentus]|uniref:Sodium/proton antiporter (CPA1 family) n=1 Tax=Actinoplanes lutulentus TaxID=1287878 RepID=A0A327YWW9_9ACTN|nr:sodium:proton antiporter [Actinoplanes lutulentus]MBB2940462.1 CPA1 family monovalent cation:H+ antiporter [Actinoplanes lutulentus]RAK25806.1 sodium/proton antiporter (CPA1 family) [Actinoplanes lutulentus]
MNGVQLLLIVGVGIAVTAVARRHRIEPGWVIVALAAAASFIPGVPRLELESELILALVIPPLLYSATRNAQVSTFGANLKAIIYLGVVTVVLTAGVLGWLSSLLLPSIGIGAAFVLGTVLAPPDTITTVSHGDEMGLPKRATSILTGESLVNDATALTLFVIAVATVNGEHATWGGGIAAFFRNALIGLAIGGVLSTITLMIRKRLGNPTLETVLVLLLPFIAFLIAEELHASGILAVVAAAFSVSINVTLDPNFAYPGAYRTRLQEEQVWKTLDFLLETFVFAYIGLQLKWVVEELAASEEPGLVRTLVAAGVLLVVAIVFRMVAVFGLFGRWTLRHRRYERRMATDVYFRQTMEARNARRRGGERLPPPTMKENVLVGWTGMRGILTLAAAAGIPEHTASGAPFPGRDAIQAIALILTLGTLLIQGTTVGWLARRLKFDVSAERAAAEQMRARGHELIAAAVSPGDASADALFDAQRLAIATAVRDRQITEEVARELVEELDLRQAARHA